MKTPYPILALLLLLLSCAKQETTTEQGDKWNGYFRYVKCGEVTKTLWADKDTDIGTVTYGIDDSANFYVKYNCTEPGWQITKTNMFAGDKVNLPRHRPWNPRYGRFPHCRNHSYSWVNHDTYKVPLTSLPPCDEPGFVVASHCVVHSPGGQYKMAWADGDFSFNDRDWGWYDIYYFNQEENESITLYGTELTEDSLKLYLIDVSNNTSELIMAELVDGAPGQFDAAAFQPDVNLLYFADYDSGELWAASVDDDTPPFLAGTLTGTPASATFHGGYYYYVDDETHTINRVSFNTDGTIQTITVLSTLPNSNPVSDIAMNSTGTNLYIVSNRDEGTDLITWNVNEDTYYLVAVVLEPGAQIAFGSDGNLYAFEETTDGDGTSASILSTETGAVVPIEGGSSIVEQPISDVSSGKTL
jgi:sugar lactone lactonase YvrE